MAIDRDTDPAALVAARSSAARRRTGWPRRTLSGRIAALMWMLRLYVVGMLAVVAVQIARLI
ncbi:MAG TPA: hypothetical protein VJ779_13245 [Acetobacteraceae bacterium]|nr:hypothetical protein [Acetobacteraceae bacterium]